MSIRKRIVPAGIVLVAGFCAALPFQKRPAADARPAERGDELSLPSAAAISSLFTPAAQAAQNAATDPDNNTAAHTPLGDAEAEAASQLAGLAPTGLQAVHPPTTAGEAAPTKRAGTESRPMDAAAAPDREQATLLPLSAPENAASPDLPLHFPAALATRAGERPGEEASNRSIVEVAERSAAETAPARLEGIDPQTDGGQGEAPSAVPAIVVKRHRIRDGDTLARLAARYLGAADRGGEIFAQNRDVLSQPDLLPIGREIAIRVPAERLAED